jgi:hypothetical protein
MEAKFIRTKPRPTQTSQQTVQASSGNSSNQSKSNKSEKNNAEEKEKDHLKEQYFAKLLASGFGKDNLK